jgi:hypothetical protein
MANRPADSVDNIIDAIVRESDRGCVLVSAAWIEDPLKSAIKGVFLKLFLYGPNPTQKYEDADSMHESLVNGALGRAGTRVNFCRSTGMINDDCSAALNALFGMRNQHFAHFAGVSRLSDPLINDLYANFTKAVEATNRGPIRPLRRKIGVKAHSKRRKHFMGGILILSSYVIKSTTDMFTAIPNPSPSPRYLIPASLLNTLPTSPQSKGQSK